tara:strand:+ start:70 stop:1278 length:1209 start_codon:yes stop_codon:yes gene_type:complete
MKKNYLTILIALISFGLHAQTSVTFSGTGNQYVEIDPSTSADFQFAEEFTIEAWTKQSTLGVWPALVTNFDGGGIPNASGYWFGINGNGNAGLQVFDSSGVFFNVGGTTNIIDNNWHHIAGTYKNDSLFVFVDGVLEGAAIGPVTAKYSGQPIWFGTDNLADYLLGEVDDIRIWGVARTSNEIQLYKDSCLDGSQNNLIGLWHFEEGAGSQVYDISGNNHTGTMVGMDTITSWTSGIYCTQCELSGISELTVSTSGVNITSNNTSATYQWLDCNNGYSIIVGEFGQSYTATANGNYAIELTENGCADTTACVSITTVGIIENSFGNNLLVYPNPTNGDFYIDLGAVYENSDILITDISGKLIESKNITQSQVLNLSLEEPAGIYIVSIQSGNQRAVIRLIKQ